MADGLLGPLEGVSIFVIGGDESIDVFAQLFGADTEVKSRYEKHGERSNRQVGGCRESCVKEHEATIRGWIRARDDLMLFEIFEKLALLGVRIKIPALWHQLNKWDLTFKKNPFTPASKNAKT